MARILGMNRILPVLAAAILAGCSSPEKPAEITWQPWSDAAFATAKRENKLVLLDLGAVWCHWCHVMDRETYGDPAVARYIGEHYVAIHVNQDERPDLANRYEDYGWPATILFAADGTELGKFRGFMPPKRLLSLLEAFVADPTPGPSAMEREPAVVAGSSTLPKELDDALHERWAAAYDHKEQGWGTVHKYLDPDCVELAISEGRGDMARGTLDAMLQLIDPVWGGVYQYSDGGVWTNPHFEKIMSFQAEDLRIYALAYRVYGEVKYLEAAWKIQRYMTQFLREVGGFAYFASQDADLVLGEHAADYFALDWDGRRRKGIPRIDRHQYARENGWAAVGLTCLHRARPIMGGLIEPQQTVRWVVAHRGLPEGGFAHDEADSAGPYLGDSLAVARAFFELHQTTADDEYLRSVEMTLRFIERRFRADTGYATAAATAEAAELPAAPRPQTDENIGIARLAIRMFHLTEAQEWKAMAEHAMSYLAGVAPDASGIRAAGILLAAREVSTDPLKVVVVGALHTEATNHLLGAVRSAPCTYMVIRRVDPGASEEYLLDGNAPTGYVCTDTACNGPFHDPEALRKAASPPRRR